MIALPDYLTRNDGREILVSGHRIGLHQIIAYYNDGYSAEMLAEQFPTLPLAVIHKTIAFYLENRAEADAYIRELEEDLRTNQASGRQVDLAEFRERLNRRNKPELVRQIGS